MRANIFGSSKQVSGYESDVADNLVKIIEWLETNSSDISSNKNTVVRLDEDLHGLASNVDENIEKIAKLEKRISDVEKQIDEKFSNLQIEIMLIKAEHETKTMDMKSYLDMVANRVNDIESSTNDRFNGLQIEASNKLNNVEVTLNDSITTQRAYIDDLVMGIQTFLNKLEKKVDRSNDLIRGNSDQNKNIENIIGGVSSDTILHSEEINNLKKVIQSYKDENAELSERINKLVAANVNWNLRGFHLLGAGASTPALYTSVQL